MTKHEIEQEALANARNGQVTSNYGAIYAGFAEKGIAESDIQPRVNVFSYNAWKAQGRQGRKGEHGVKGVTFVPMTARTKGDDGAEREESFRRPRTVAVFHVSQTEESSR